MKLTHHLKDKVWLGKGTIRSSAWKDELHFVCRFQIGENRDGSFFFKREIELSSTREKTETKWLLSDFFEDAFSLFDGATRIGEGSITSHAISYAYTHDQAVGKESLVLTEKGELLFSSTLSQQDLYTLEIDANLWKSS